MLKARTGRRRWLHQGRRWMSRTRSIISSSNNSSSVPSGPDSVPAEEASSREMFSNGFFKEIHERIFKRISQFLSIFLNHTPKRIWK
jgi:hypothetical protein